MSDEESLREASCIGNVEKVEELLRLGIDVNSKNGINGWTALHWAVKRGHSAIVKLLLEYGADPDILNNKDQKAADLAPNAFVSQVLCKDAEEVLHSHGAEKETPQGAFIPSYLANPVFPYGTNSTCKKASSGKVINGGNSSPTKTENDSSKQEGPQRCLGCTTIEKEPKQVFHTASSTSECILKVREADSLDTDFYETYLPTTNLTFQSLLELCCCELDIALSQVCKIRKLPNTIIRTDKNVQHLKNLDELELVVRR